MFESGKTGLILLPAALVFLLQACDEGGSTGPIRFAYQNRVGSALCIAAVERGLFRKEGIAVKASRFNSGPACSEALYSGSADIAAMGDTTAIIAVSRSPAFRIIASHGAGEHRHRIVVREDSPLAAPEDLVTRRLAVKKGTSTYGGLLAFCDKAGIAIGDIRVIDMRPHEMTEALQAGSIDAFVASEPTPSLAEARGARELATLGGLGNKYPILLVARKNFLEQRPDEVARFMQAMKRAEEFVRDNPAETVALLSRISGLPRESARRAMGWHVYRLSLDANIRESLANTAEFLHSEVKIDAVPNWTLSLESRIAPAK